MHIVGDVLDLRIVALVPGGGRGRGRGGLKRGHGGEVASAGVEGGGSEGGGRLKCAAQQWQSGALRDALGKACVQGLGGLAQPTVDSRHRQWQQWHLAMADGGFVD